LFIGFILSRYSVLVDLARWVLKPELATTDGKSFLILLNFVVEGNNPEGCEDRTVALQPRLYCAFGALSLDMLSFDMLSLDALVL
jgi:hypothetical protein